MFIDIGLTIVIPTLLVAAVNLVIGRKRQAVADGERGADSLSSVDGVLAALFTGLRVTPVNVAVMSILTAVIGITISISMEPAHPLSGPFAAEALAFPDALGELTGPSL